jgi:hypothetical protein
MCRHKTAKKQVATETHEGAQKQLHFENFLHFHSLNEVGVYFSSPHPR